MVKDASGWISELLAEASEMPAPEISPTGVLQYSETLGRRVRADTTWESHAVATYTRAIDAIEAGQWAEAAEYVDFFYDEAAVIHGFFEGLIPDAVAFLAERGVGRAQLLELNRRLIDLIRLPDGRPFVSGVRWAEFEAEMRRCLVAVGAQERDEALESLAELKEIWRQVQDRDVDHLYGLLNEAVVYWGEEAVGDFWSAIIGPLFESRYEKFDVQKNPWSESLWTNVYLAMEAMRGHLVGPERDGNMEFSEDEDRYTWRFDPCGSGGRSMLVDAVEGSPPRMESPFEFGVFSEEFDFAWNTKGVCYYCVNCCMVMQLMPIDHFGYPVRVTEPPTYPNDGTAKCTWHVYKDPAKVPERYYTDVGRQKPDVIPGLEGSGEGAD